MSAVLPLARRQLTAAVRVRALVPPAVAVLLLLLLVGSNGPQEPRSAFADTAVLLLPVSAWLVSRTLDATPDRQRELDVLAAGPLRVALAAIVAGTAVASVLVPTATLLLLPTLRAPSLGDVLRGLAVLLLLLPCAVALGVLAARPVVRTPAGTAGVVLGGGVLLLLLSRASPSPLAALAPPLLQLLRDGSGSAPPHLPRLAVHAVLWAAVVLAGWTTWRGRHP